MRSRAWARQICSVLPSRRSLCTCSGCRHPHWHGRCPALPVERRAHVASDGLVSPPLMGWSGRRRNAWPSLSGLTRAAGRPILFTGGLAGMAVLNHEHAAVVGRHGQGAGHWGGDGRAVMMYCRVHDAGASDAQAEEAPPPLSRTEAPEGRAQTGSSPRRRPRNPGPSSPGRRNPSARDV